MSDPLGGADRLLVLRHAGHALVRVVGRGTFKISGALKEFVGRALDDRDAGVVVDLEACTGMDSTFMGVIAGLAMRLKKASGGRVILANVNNRLSELLSTLGLSLLVEVLPPGQAEGKLGSLLAQANGLVAVGGASKENTASVMLEAHENLVRASPDNLPKFKDVLEYLRADVERKKTPAGGNPS
ncbi:MAG: STAS domain-containing protein [Kiritimatiellae bacterium]|nr:STAS domain-containing protein [Kiritimatiellia bacterium]